MFCIDLIYNIKVSAKIESHIASDIAYADILPISMNSTCELDDLRNETSSHDACIFTGTGMIGLGVNIAQLILKKSVFGLAEK